MSAISKPIIPNDVQDNTFSSFFWTNSVGFRTQNAQKDDTITFTPHQIPAGAAWWEFGYT